MLMSRLCTDGRTDGNVKVEQYSAEAESAISCCLADDLACQCGTVIVVLCDTLNVVL